MPNTPVVTPARIRLLLKLHRKRLGLSQRQAADKAGISTVWWRHIETGHAETVPALTLARMAYAAGLPASRLRELGLSRVAELASELEEMPEDEQAEGEHTAEEEWLAQGPFDDETKRSLLAHLRALKATDPLSRGWPRKDPDTR